MTNITRYPLEDGYETSLAQSWDWQVWTITVNSSPNFTFPAWVTTFIVIDPWKTTMQIAEINAYNSWLKTITVSSISSLEKWAGVSSTAVNHSVWAKVVISDNYQFWKDILNAVNSKIDADDWLWVIYADVTARDTALTSPSNWMQVYVTSLWLFTDYIGWTWTNRATWSTPNASETVAGKVEISTQAENDAWTETWGTGALLVTNPLRLWKSIQKQTYIYDEDTWVSDVYVITLTPAPTVYTEWMKITVKIWSWNTNTGASTINVNGLWAKAIQDKDWDALNVNQLITGQVYDMIYDWTQFKLLTIEKLSDTEFNTWTDTQKYVNASQSNFLRIVAWTTYWLNAENNVVTYSTTYVKLKEIQVYKAWTYTIDFQMYSFGTSLATGRIYVNWIAVWTERSTTANSPWVAYSENLTVARWDLVQLYMKNDTWWAEYTTWDYFRVQNDIEFGNIILD